MHKMYPRYIKAELRQKDRVSGRETAYDRTSGSNIRKGDKSSTFYSSFYFAHYLYSVCTHELIKK